MKSMLSGATAGTRTGDPFIPDSNTLTVELYNKMLKLGNC